MDENFQLDDEEDEDDDDITGFVLCCKIQIQS